MELLSTNNLDQLSDREKALFAKVHDYAQGHNPQTAAELVALGLDQNQVVQLVKKFVTKDLEKLETNQVQRKIFQSQNQSQIEGAISQSTRTESLEDFSKKYGLDSERTALSEIAIRGSFSSTVDTSRVLKSAIMTNDRELIKRSFHQAFKHSDFDELTALAASSNDNKALINLGRLNIARYLFFDRNHNWLSEGLRSFSEVTGEDRNEVTTLLYDLFSLLRSPAILANESEIRNYGQVGELDNYSDDAAKVLIATLPVDRRLKGDDSSAFSYLYKRTNDLQYVNRVKGLLRESMSAGQNIGFLMDAVAQIDDVITLKKIAREAEAYSRKVPKNSSGRDADVFMSGAHGVANTALVTAADLNELTKYYQRTLAAIKAKEYPRAQFGFQYGDKSLLAPSSVVKLFRSFIENPQLLSADTNKSDLSHLANWIEHYDYHQKHSSKQVSPTGKMFYAVNTWHEEDTIEYNLKKGVGASEEQIREFKSEGQRYLLGKNYWEAMGSFISAKDLEGLDRTYKAMMTDGRPLDAVYVALAMEWIRTGRSPFDQMKKVAGTSQLKIQ